MPGVIKSPISKNQPFTVHFKIKFSKGPGAKKATRESPGYFNQILNFAPGLFGTKVDSLLIRDYVILLKLENLSCL